jgi:hypothetical protein
MINNIMRKSRDEIEILKIYEEMTAGDVYGDVPTPVGIENKDSYATGNMLNPYGLGITTRKGRLKTAKKNTKKTKIQHWDGSV